MVQAPAWVMKGRGYLWGCCMQVKEEGGWVLTLDGVVCTSKTCVQARCLLSLGISSSGMSKHHNIQNHKPLSIRPPRVAKDPFKRVCKVLPFLTMYLCEASFSPHTSTQTAHHRFLRKQTHRLAVSCKARHHTDRQHPAHYILLFWKI